MVISGEVEKVLNYYYMLHTYEVVLEDKTKEKTFYGYIRSFIIFFYTKIMAKQKLVLIMDYDKTITYDDSWKKVFIDISHNKQVLSNFLGHPGAQDVEALLKRIMVNDAKVLGIKDGIPPTSWFADSLNALDRQYHLKDPVGAELSPGSLFAIGSGIKHREGFREFYEWINDKYNVSFYIVSTSPRHLIQGSYAGSKAKKLYCTEIYYNRDKSGTVTWYINQPMTEKLKPWAVMDILEEEYTEGVKVVCMGDGATDLYMFKQVMEHGGHSILVYDDKIDKEYDGLYDVAVKADYVKEIPELIKRIME